jgi:hypothetical protein
MGRAIHRLAWLFALVCIAGAATQASAAPTRRVLVSVEGVSVPKGSSIFGYRIATWGVEFLAICRVPPSWELKSEKFEDPEGYLSGRADAHAVRLRALTRFYLVDVVEPQPFATGEPETEHPASFSGWIEVGSRARFGDWRGWRVKLSARNFHLEDVQRCPAPPA